MKMTPLFRHRTWLLAVILIAILVGGLVWMRVERKKLDHLTNWLGFGLPQTVQVVAYTDEIRIFDFSKSWLVEFPEDEALQWMSNSRFRECLPSSNRGEDYPYIRGIIHSDFPDMATRFQRPRIWRGGHDGNCYIGTSDDGSLIYFHYFQT